MIFKPHKQQIHVPGHGVVQKEDFTQDHFNTLMKRAGNNKDAFIKQHFVVASYEDMPIFEEEKKETAPAQKVEKKQGKKKAEKPTDEEELSRLIAEEEAANKKEKQGE